MRPYQAQCIEREISEIDAMLNALDPLKLRPNRSSD